MMYRGMLPGDWSNQFTRVKSGAGSLRNISGSDFWAAPDGNFYYTTYTNWSNHTIKKVSFSESGSSSVSDYASLPQGVYVQGLWNSFKFTFADRIIIAYGYNADVVEVYNPINTPKVINGYQYSTQPLSRFPLARIDKATQSENYYYLAGQDADGNSVLLKVDPIDSSYTNLIDGAEYSMYTMDASSDDEVTFSALRLSDGAKVTGNISAAGEIAIIDAAGNTEPVALVRLN